jgi:hypothetical protein
MTRCASSMHSDHLEADLKLTKAKSPTSTDLARGAESRP